MSELWATRDASFYNRPDVDSPKKYHRVVNQKEILSGQRGGTTGEADCNKALLDTDFGAAFGEALDERQKCKRCVRKSANTPDERRPR